MTVVVNFHQRTDTTASNAGCNPARSPRSADHGFISASLPTTPSSLTLLLIILGGCLNGYAVRISEALYVPGMATLFLGLSPFDLIVMFAAATLLLEHSSTDGAPDADAGPVTRNHVRIGLPEAIALVCVLIPSSTISWLAVAIYSGYYAVRLTDARRYGLALFAGLALTALWSSVGMKYAGPTITTIEAAMVAAILSVAIDGVAQSGNVVGNPQVFSLIVMAACSTLDGLPKALLGLGAVMWLSGTLRQQPYIASAAALIAIYATANMVRLSTMAVSEEWYQLAHGPVGAGVFDATIVATVFALSLCWSAPDQAVAGNSVSQAEPST
ncbi:MAG: hypothetical protein AAFV45_16005 [Pseudomonadota bacterium]